MPINKGYLTAKKTPESDECLTPYYAVDPLLEFLTDKSKIIWCPFDKEWSAFNQVLTGGGMRVICSHIDDGKDFFEYEPDHWDIMISNPPFSKKDKVLERAFSFNKPFALLLPANSIQGKKRFQIFNNEIQMLCFDSRVGFFMNGDMQHVTEGTAFGSAYFCRDFLPSKLELRELYKYERALVE